MDIKKELIKVAEGLTREDVQKMRDLATKTIKWLNESYSGFIRGKLSSETYTLKDEITTYIKLDNKAIFSFVFKYGLFTLIFGSVGYKSNNRKINYKKIPTLSRIVKYFDSKTVDKEFGFKVIDEKDLIEDIVKDFKTFYPVEQNNMTDKGEIRVNKKEITYDFRYLGKWNVPDDVDEDEAEDYDWEELDDRSYVHIESEFKKWAESYYWYKFIKQCYISPEEKNWIYFTIQLL